MCKGYPCVFEEIATYRLGVCLKQKGWTSTCIYFQTPPSNIQEGDVIVYHESSCDDWNAHVAIVISGGTIPKIDCHSAEQYNVYYKYMSNDMSYYHWLYYNG